MFGMVWYVWYVWCLWFVFLSLAFCRWHSLRVLQAEQCTPTPLGSLPVQLEDEVIPATEVLEALHFPAYTEEGVACRADRLLRLAHDDQLQIRVAGEPTHHAAKHCH